MEQALGAAASGGIFAMCSEILDEYPLAAPDETFFGWLAVGAPSADAQERLPKDNGRARAEQRKPREDAPSFMPYAHHGIPE
jgi:hypothetical protein